MQFLHVLHPVSAGTVTGMNINPPLNLDWHKKDLGNKHGSLEPCLFPKWARIAAKRCKGYSPLYGAKVTHPGSTFRDKNGAAP